MGYREMRMIAGSAVAADLGITDYRDHSISCMNLFQTGGTDI